MVYGGAPTRQLGRDGGYNDTRRFHLTIDGPGRREQRQCLEATPCMGITARLRPCVDKEGHIPSCGTMSADVVTDALVENKHREDPREDTVQRLCCVQSHKEMQYLQEAGRDVQARYASVARGSG